MKKNSYCVMMAAAILGLTGCAGGKEVKPEEVKEIVSEVAEAVEELSDEDVSAMAEEVEEMIKAGSPVEFTPMYNEDDQVIHLEYNGLDMEGLANANKRYGSEGFGDTPVDQGCSITFATYKNGTTGAVRNMDLHLSDYSSYDIIINPGENVKYPTWALAYTGVDEKSYKDILETGISDNRYKTLPFTTTDAMSFGYKEDGSEGSLYCALLIRGDEQDEDGNYIWTCSGTNPGAPIRCATQSIATLIATQNLSVEDALKYVGAEDENYNKLYPDVEPTLDVYTLNVETGTASNHWFEVCAMIDDTGHHGVLEFIDNHPIWHDNIDYSFNFFLQKEYLYNQDGTFRETGGSGIGRMEATIPYLDKIITVADHVDLMDGIRYSYMTYYNEDTGYVGSDWNGQKVDWRSEFTHGDIWDVWEKFNKTLGIDTSAADAKYPPYAHYIDTETGKLVLIDSYEKYVENREHLKSAYDMNYVMSDKNYDELMNYIRWNGKCYYDMTEDQVKSTRSGWETYFRVVADPMNHRVTRWFNENYNTADTISFKDVVK